MCKKIFNYSDQITKVRVVGLNDFEGFNLI